MIHNQRARLSAQVMENLEINPMLPLRNMSFEEEGIRRYLSSRLIVEQGSLFQEGVDFKTPRLYLLELLLGHFSFPMDNVGVNDLFIAVLNVTSALSGSGCALTPSAMDLKIASEFFVITGNQTSLLKAPNYECVFELLRETYQYITSLYIEQRVNYLEQYQESFEEE